MKTDQVLSKIDQVSAAGRPITLESNDAKLIVNRVNNLEMLVGHLLMTVKLAGISCELPQVKEAV
jgi:hypothetical protein